VFEEISEFAAENRASPVRSRGSWQTNFCRTRRSPTPRHHAFVRIAGSLGDGFKEMVVLFTDTIGGDVFRDFSMDRLFVRLDRLG